jgi:hypothetical protein
VRKQIRERHTDIDNTDIDNTDIDNTAIRTGGMQESQRRKAAPHEKLDRRAPG